MNAVRDARGYPRGQRVRHLARLYTTFGDWAQDVLGAVYFPSTRTQPQQLDAEKYVHDPDSAPRHVPAPRRERHPTGPMFEPFDQQAPLTHFDIFVRPDRVILFVNGRRAWCGDLADRPLTMDSGLITYGDGLYPSSAETSQAYVGVEQYQGAVGGSFHYVMNTPWADTRAWDAAGQSEKIDIPSQFTFDAGACFKPKSTAIR